MVLVVVEEIEELMAAEAQERLAAETQKKEWSPNGATLFWKRSVWHPKQVWHGPRRRRKPMKPYLSIWGKSCATTDEDLNHGNLSDPKSDDKIV